MGASQSSFCGRLTQSRVQAFHSISKWTTYFNKIRGSSQLIVIDFSASWCGPCKFFEPAFIELSKEYTDVIFVKIDIDELETVAQEFGVTSVPTFVLIKQDNIVDTVVGADKDELEKMIKKHST